MGECEGTSSRYRLLVIVNVFNPDRGGGGAIFSDLCYALAERGHDVTVRCAYPYYPEWRDKSGRNGLAIQRYDENGLRVERYGIFIPRNPHSLLQRLLYEASFFFSLSRSWLRRREFDLVMVYCPLMGAVAYSALDKWLRRKPLWLNVQDLSADAAAASGIVRGRALKKALRFVQRRLFNQADIWSSISPVMIERLKAIRSRNQPILYLPNWLNASMAQEIQSLPIKLGRVPTENVKLLYAGNIGAKQDLLRLCKALLESDADFKFRVHGNGAEASAVQRWVETCGDHRFTFGPFLDERSFAAALHETDLFVITEKAGSGGSFIPCKLIAGIASGNPILAVCDPESPLGQEVRSTDIGPWFSWEDLAKIPPLLRTLALESDRFTTWQSNALSRSEFFRQDRLIPEFDKAVHSILEGHDLSETRFDNEQKAQR